jgi:predicted nucleotidyltransferase component of viral defense system
MNGGERSSVVRVHEDLSLFREAVNFTAAETAFPARLIEKDYFCTMLIEYLSEASGGLVFKGGTCLSKVHADFYRLSEDLDFVVPLPVNAPRAERSKQAKPLKESVEKLPKQLPEFHLVDPLKGANNSTQYVAIVRYSSLIRQQEETIKIEVGLREPLLTPVMKGPVRTIILNPVSGKALVPPIPFRCI